jgi:hypothetical protein
MAWVVVIVAVVGVIALVAYFVVARHPEEAASGPPDRSDQSTEMFGEVHDRPGSPGAEGQGVADRGQIVPGPSAEATDLDGGDDSPPVG